MRQLVLILSIEGPERDQSGNDLVVGDRVIAHRRYDSSPRYEIGEEASRALGNLLLPELRKISLFWEHPDPDYDYTEGGMW